MDKITIVIPLIKYHYELFNDICLKSIYAFFDMNSLDKIILILPEKDINYITNKLKNNNKIEFINERDIYNHTYKFKSGINKYGNIITKEWKIQQILKIKIAKYINTKIFMIFDADCFFIKKCKYTDIVINNKCIFNQEINNNYKKWWTNSNQYIKYDKKIDCFFGVTPSLLYKDICNELINYINIEEAIDNTATEYTLYWLYILKFKNYKDLYCNINEKFLYGNCIWSEYDIINFDINKYKNSNFYTSLIQGNLINKYNINDRIKVLNYLLKL